MISLRTSLVVLMIIKLIFPGSNGLEEESELVYPSIRSYDLSENSETISNYRKYLHNKTSLMLEIRFPRRSKTYLAKLEINQNLMSKHGVIETKKSKNFYLKNQNCHFNGKFVNVSNSLLTVSLCNGLVKLDFYFPLFV